MRPRYALLLPLAALAVLPLAACGGSSSVSDAQLRPLLLKSSAVPGFSLQRHFDWKDPVDLVGQGFKVPERTAPSTALKVVKDAGVRGATGEVLARGTGFNHSEITVGVVKFKSDSGANKVRDWMHGQDLQEPCFSECTFTPRALNVPGVRSARLVAQSGQAPPPPPGAAPGAITAPPTNYLVEFTVGPYLYFASMEGGASQDLTAFTTGTQRYYAQVKGKQT